MTQWFETKVKYDKTLETGAVKAVPETYLVDALSFTEAEARITEEMMPYVTGEFMVTAVRKAKFDDVLYHEGGDRWYKVKINMITIDEKTAAEKKTPSLTLVQASTLEEALQVFLESMKGVAFDYEIASVIETPLMDVFAADLSKTLADKKEE
ncbi:MAG: DUF4494 domain-containing protein [Muribaculaceae bacterium]|jgi:hypothetical protein|nr:DUF4494 domain-containing protein [Muribaculaceae bacterium]MBQ1723610.1 DUF4494 domain-containing protein [Muribaculaceae bacterium]MBQ2490745.1 DUF4494 domain-containing protein [Muribaculaceae bacterium]MBQ4007260.1 DUF4494 domain-containing protein [Muribaculaceae bacterium]